MLSCSSTRDPAMQVCPVAANTPASTPLQALARSASSKMMLGDLPPSSSETRARWSAAPRITDCPVAEEPVKAILATSGWRTSAAPAPSPRPVTTLTTPSGKPASSITAASSRVEAGETSDGLTTTVLPAASAGHSFHSSSRTGEFQGAMAPTTPSGSRRV
jgi:hypothetical protein